MPSYSDFLNANTGNEANVAQTDLSQAQSGQNAGVAAQGATPTGAQQSYGDFLKALQGNDSGSAAGALGGGNNAFDAMLFKGGASGQLQQAQQAYDSNQASQASGQAQSDAIKSNAATSQANYATSNAKALQEAAKRAGNTGDVSGITDQNSYAAAQKQGQTNSLAAGAQYRLAKEKAQFEADQKRNAGIEQGVSSILNPAQGLAWASTDFGHGHQTDFSRDVGDPLGLGGDAHSGFGPGGKFGSPGGLGDASQGDPFGQYSNDDAGFASWLKKQGYDSTTGNGGGSGGY